MPSAPSPSPSRPERFLGEDDRDGAEAALSNRAWLPFGGGRRYCVGAQLALLEVRVIIAEVLARVELAAPDPTPEVPKMKHVTFVPAHQTRVVARGRRDVAAPAVPKAT